MADDAPTDTVTKVMTKPTPRPKRGAPGDRARLEEAARGFVSVDESAERAVIAALLTEPQTFLDVTDLVSESDFGSPAMREIFSAIVACDAAGRPLDQITIADQLRKTKRLKNIGGVEQLEALVSEASSVGNVAAHARIVSDKALLRRLIATGREIATLAMAGEHEATDALEAAESAVFALSREREHASLVEMAQAVAETLGELARVRSSQLIGVPTGFSRLDALTGGFQSGQLIIIAGRPGTGKSAFALAISRHVAEKTGLIVPFFSYEMSRSELTMRLLSGALNYDLLKLRSGDLAAGMDLDLARAAENLAAAPLLIDDHPPATISGLRSLLRRVARRGQIGAVVVDYLQLMEGDRSRGRDDNRTTEVSEISRGLKRLGTELGVPIIALSQLNRAVEQRPNKRPMLSDLRESGSLEQDASLVLMLYRDSLYGGEGPGPGGGAELAEVLIAKQRNGPSGTTVYVDWFAHAASYRDTTRVPEKAASSFRSPRPSDGFF